MELIAIGVEEYKRKIVRVWREWKRNIDTFKRALSELTLVKNESAEYMISVIMPVYNSEEFLEKCIKSILKQTYSKFELIIVDDGSTDKSWEICCKYANCDSRIKCYRVSNRGVSEARNYGLYHATGQYIRFIDSDDEMPKDSLEKMIQPLLTNREIDLVIGKFTATSSSVFNEKIEGTVEFNTFIQAFSIHVPAFYYGVNWNKLYKKSIIKEYDIRFNKDVHWGEDFIFNCEYYSHCKYIHYLAEYIHIYCQREASAVNAIRVSTWYEKLRIEIQRLEAVLSIMNNRNANSEIIRNFYFYFLSALSNQFSWVEKMKDRPLKERYEIFGMIMWNRKVSELIKNFHEKNIPLFYRLMIYTINHKRPKLLYFIVFNKHLLGKNLLLKKQWNQSKSSPIHFEI